jgi:hypothetical protein
VTNTSTAYKIFEPGQMPSYFNAKPIQKLVHLHAVTENKKKKEEEKESQRLTFVTSVKKDMTSETLRASFVFIFSPLNFFTSASKALPRTKQNIWDSTNLNIHSKVK